MAAGNTPPELPPRAFRLTLVAAVAVLLAVLAWPLVDRLLVTLTAEPRAVTPRGDLAADERATIEIFETASPSVVYITTIKRVVELWTRNVLEVPSGTGTGFVWDSHGHVVTNLHVVQGAQAAEVRLADQRTLPASLVGASREHDLAVLRLRVPFDPPPPLTIGTSRDLKVGQKVFAIGNPFGLDHSLTTGVISALDRSIGDEDGTVIEHLIQTDAAINPGNSGGPLLDSAGRLIGVNTAIYSPSGAYAGVGFAVPVDTVNRVVPQLVAHGRYVRPSLGIVSDDAVSRRVTDRLETQGVLVLRVQPGSPAERAGVRGTVRAPEGGIVPGDVVQAVDGQAVDRGSELEDLVARRALGEQVSLTLWRAGDVVEVPLTLSRWGK
jgi:S1-C subfamily serine protease